MTILTKWQCKYNRPVPKSLKKCPFCKEEVKIWNHYTKCGKTPQEILDLKKIHLKFLKDKAIDMEEKDIMDDINFEKVQGILR